MSTTVFHQNKSDHEIVEKMSNTVDSGDTHCGHIFYNKNTWLLKYSCTFCEQIYEDINIFCEHLTQHVAENNNLNNEEDLVEDMNVVKTTQESDMIIDSMDDYCEEVGETLDNQIIVESGEFLVPDKITDVEEIIQNETIVDRENHNNNVDFEQFIEEKIVPTKLVPQMKQHVAVLKKPKKVTRVKIIAVKNRIAELYEQIKKEERKRSADPNSTTLHDDAVDTDDNPLLTDNEDDESGDESLEASKAANHDKNDKSCKCPACGETFTNRYSLTRHKRSHYMESKNNIKLAHKCPNCDALFNRICELKVHLQKVHYPDGFICKICNRELTSIALLETHMRKVHLSKPFNCRVCNKNFVNREEFEIHEGTHFIMSENFKCRICGRKYPTEMALNLHVRNHKEQVPERCVVCGKMTLRITQHMKIHQPGPKRIHICQICGKTFNFSSGLSQHKRYHEKEANLSQKLTKKESPQKKNIRRKITEPEVVENEKAVKETIYQDEEAKRVIVELIQNVTYKSFTPDESIISEMNALPIAREETISSVNSINYN